MRFHEDPCLQATGLNGAKKPLRPKGTRGSGAWVSTLAEARGRVTAISLLTSLVVDLALSDVGRAARGVADAAGVPASTIPATLAFALSRRGLFYPLASLDISGQWPVFEQEPHRNGRSVLPRAVNAQAANRPSIGIVFLRVGRGKRDGTAERAGRGGSARAAGYEPPRAESHACANCDQPSPRAPASRTTRWS